MVIIAERVKRQAFINSASRSRDLILPGDRQAGGEVGSKKRAGIRQALLVQEIFGWGYSKSYVEVGCILSSPSSAGKRLQR